MKLGLVYSGEELEPRSFRAIPHHLAIVEEDIELTQIIDASSADEDRQRVKNVGRLFQLQPKRQSHLDFGSVDAVIVEIGKNPSENFKLRSVLFRAVDAGVHLHLPYDALTTLSYKEVVDLFARADVKGVEILACTRFLFGQTYTQFRQNIKDLEFGPVSDLSFRIGIGPVGTQDDLMPFVIHHLNILFDLLLEDSREIMDPIEITTVAPQASSLYQPCINFTILFARNKIANFFLTANRLWGTAYHSIEISGRNAYAVTDLGSYKCRTSIRTSTQASDGLSDDDQGHVLYGSTGKLRQFTTATKGESVTDFSQITKWSLGIYHMLQEMVAEKNINTRRISCDMLNG